MLLSLLSWLEYTYILPSFTENDKNGCELGQKPKIEARIRLSMPKTDLTTIFDHTDGLGLFFKLFGSNLQLSFLSSRGTTSELRAFGSGHDCARTPVIIVLVSQGFPNC